MKKMINVLLTPLILLALFAVFSTEAMVFYGYGKGHDDPAKEERRKEWQEKMDSELNLSQEQKKALDEHRSVNRKKMDEIRDNMSAEKKALHDELKKDALDMDKINSITARLKELSGEMVTQRLENYLDMREVLTTEQFLKLMDMKGKRKAAITSGDEKN